MRGQESGIDGRIASVALEVSGRKKPRQVKAISRELSVATSAAEMARATWSNLQGSQPSGAATLAGSIYLGHVSGGVVAVRSSTTG